MGRCQIGAELAYDHHGYPQRKIIWISMSQKLPKVYNLIMPTDQSIERVNNAHTDGSETQANIAQRGPQIDQKPKTNMFPKLAGMDLPPSIILRELAEEKSDSKERLRSLSTERTPSLYQINTRVWLHDTQKGQAVGQLSDEVLDTIARDFDYVWFMGIYKQSPYSKQFNSQFHDAEFPRGRTTASPFAIPEYAPSPAIAKDWKEWDQFVERLHARGVKVIIDFVPNHVAVDHPWVQEHPEYFAFVSQEEYDRLPPRRENDGDKRVCQADYYTYTAQDGKTFHLAYGKDPNYATQPWTDTLQLNYANPKVNEEMKQVLLNLVDHADGVRCDMAMLEDPETFQRTWGLSAPPENFWKGAIAAANQKAAGLGKDFTFLAEAYWDHQELLEDKFNLLYDKEYYDNIGKLLRGEITHEQFRAHLQKIDEPGFPYILFTENHDEPRAAAAFGIQAANAAAVITACSPSLWMMHEGQEEARRIRTIAQVDYRPNEVVDIPTQQLYGNLLTLRKLQLFRQGEWHVPNLVGGDTIISQQVEREKNGAIICTNFSNNESGGKGFVRLPTTTNSERILVVDIASGKRIQNPDAIQEVDGEKRLYIDIPPWGSEAIFYETE